MNNLSFGRIKLLTEVKVPTESQKNAVKYAQRAFAPHKKIPFRYGVDPITGLEYSLDEALEKVRGADVLITSKKNGNIELKVIKPLPAPDKNGKIKYYVPCESYENRLVKEINIMQPQIRMLHQLDKFARRCEYYVRAGNTGINKKIEERLMNQG